MCGISKTDNFLAKALRKKQARSVTGTEESFCMKFLLKMVLNDGVCGGLQIEI